MTDLIYKKKGIKPEEAAATQAMFLELTSKRSETELAQVWKKNLTKGMDVHAIAPGGYTLMHMLCNWQDAHTISRFMERLLQAGLSPNARDDEGGTPLHIVAAREESMLSAIQALCREGASLLQRTRREGTPLNCAGVRQNERVLILWRASCAEAAKALPRTDCTPEKLVEAVREGILRSARKIAGRFPGNGYKSGQAKWEFLTIIQPPDYQEARQQLDYVRGGAEGFACFVEGLMRDWPSPEECVTWLLSVLPPKQLFHPSRWKGHEEEAFALMRSPELRPWLREELQPLVLRMQASMDRRQVREVAPLRAWHQSVRAGEGDAARGGGHGQ